MSTNPRTSDTTLDPVAISSLPWLSTQQACIYLHMSHVAFTAFVRRHRLPYHTPNPRNPRARRTYSRTLLDQAMHADMEQHQAPALSQGARERVATIMGEQS